MDLPTSAPSLKDLYDTDFYAWTRAQAESLRRLAGEPVHAALGAQRLADEIEALGQERRVATDSSLVEIIAWRLMLEVTRFPEYRSAWEQEVANHRNALAKLLTPSLTREVRDTMDQLYPKAVALAERRLLFRGDRFGAARLPLRCPWALGELVRG